ncbi:hypothetical protein PIB30_025280 [Stylosanthes scabra]|uniref:Reverse transcriptase zinc-binding domain-containing protein n=1 Tax=Stylosanthes scabra TaxID=79078 RepID=A0ABU6UAF9_9FABA|nr:hypothetical protein [Stylosanthes scabra]
MEAATAMELGVPTMKHVFDNVWHGLVPPRVEMLTWFALTGGLKTKDVLLRRNIINHGDEWTIRKVEIRNRMATVSEETEEMNSKWVLCFCSCYNEIEDVHLVGSYVTREVNATNEEITVVVDRKDIALWLRGGEVTSWQNRFLRNKIANLADLFQECGVEFRQKRDFRVREQWDTRAKGRDQPWCHWEF